MSEKQMKRKLISRYFKVIASYKLGYPIYRPDSVSVVVTNKCNLKCVMCDFWKDTGKTSSGITNTEFRGLFEDLKAFGVRMVQFTGGEPFLRKDMLDILKSAKAAGLETAVVTNGTLIPKDDILDFVRNIDQVYVSLDSPVKDQHEMIRGVVDIFERITASAKLLTETINKEGLAAKVTFVSTITSIGIHEPLEMVKLVSDLGVDGVIYNPASTVFYGHTNLKNETSQEANTHEGYCRMIDKIISLSADTSSPIKSNPFYLLASKEFLSGNVKFYKFPCLGGGYNGPLIAFDGTVSPCCAWNVSLGNIKSRRFSEIWKSPTAREIRKKIKKGECPVCFHHTRTFDFIWRAPLLFKSPAVLLRGYGNIFRR